MRPGGNRTVFPQELFPMPNRSFLSVQGGYQGRYPSYRSKPLPDRATFYSLVSLSLPSSHNPMNKSKFSLSRSSMIPSLSLPCTRGAIPLHEFGLCTRFHIRNLSLSATPLYCFCQSLLPNLNIKVQLFGRFCRSV